MHILMTLETYDRRGGGVFEVVRQIAHQFVAQGHRVSIASSGATGHTERDGAIEVRHFNVKGNAASGYHGDLGAYVDFLQNFQCDVILSYAVQQAFSDLALRALAYRDDVVKIIVPCGYSGLYWPDFKKFFRNLHYSLRRFDRQILHTATYRDALYAQQHNLTNTVVIPNGFDASEMMQPITDAQALAVLQKYNIDPKRIRYLCVANFTGVKGHFELIACYAASLLSRATLLVVGNEDLKGNRNRYEAFTSWLRRITRGYIDVRILEIPREDTVVLYRTSHSFVFFSNMEYSPIVLYEAAAAGLSAITTPAGNSEEILQRTQGGTIVPSWKTKHGFVVVKPWSAVLAFWRLHRANRARNKPLVNAPRMDLMNYSWQEIAKQYLQLFETVQQEKGRNV